MKALLWWGFLHHRILGVSTILCVPDHHPQVRLRKKTDASTTPSKQRTTHDCLVAACEYMGPYGYDEILDKFGDSYIPGTGTNTLEALEKLYGKGSTQKLDQVYPDIANIKWKRGGSVVVAQNKNHAIVLNKIEQYKVTYKYRRNKIQTKFKYHYMNPATGNFQTTGFRKNFNYPTYYFFNK